MKLTRRDTSEIEFFFLSIINLIKNTKNLFSSIIKYT